MVDIYFEYRNIKIKIPINPEELKKSLPFNNQNSEVIGLGEVNIIRKNSLIPITIESFFPENENPKIYVAFFEKIILDKKPCRIICKDLPLNMLVSIEAFDYAMRAGEEKDRYYTLELKEWRDYSPKYISTVKKAIPKPTVKAPAQAPARPANPPIPPKTYTVKSGDSLWAITQRYTGNGARYNELYDLNKGVIGNNPSLIYPGQVYNIPQSW